MRYYELIEALRPYRGPKKKPKNFRGRKPITQDEIDDIVRDNGGDMDEWYDEVNGFKNDIEYLESFDQAVEYFNRYLGVYNIPIEIIGLQINGDEVEYEVIK